MQHDFADRDQIDRDRDQPDDERGAARTRAAGNLIILGKLVFHR